MLDAIKSQIKSATKVVDLLLFVPLVFNLDQLKQVLVNHLENHAESNTHLVRRTYYNGLGLDTILPNDIIVSILKFINSSQFESLPTLSQNFKKIIYNNVHFFNKVWCYMHAL